MCLTSQTKIPFKGRALTLFFATYCTVLIDKNKELNEIGSKNTHKKKYGDNRPTTYNN